MNYAKAITETPQSEPIPGQTQVENNAGGYVYQVDPWQQLQRFLILGSEGGSYYVGQSKLTVENAQNVIDLIKKDGAKVVTALVRVSDEGLAASNDPAIFVLALVFANGDLAAKANADFSARRLFIQPERPNTRNHTEANDTITGTVHHAYS